MKKSKDILITEERLSKLISDSLHDGVKFVLEQTIKHYEQMSVENPDSKFSFTELVNMAKLQRDEIYKGIYAKDKGDIQIH